MKFKALILGGGGSTGEFQMGALQIISQEYDHFDFYAGLGVGSLNSTVLAQHDAVSQGYQILLDVWNNIKKTGDILDVPFFGQGIGFLAAMMTDKSWGRQSVYGNTILSKIIRDHIDWNILSKKSNWAIESTSLTDGQTYTISNNADLLAADDNPNRQLRLSLNPADQYYIGGKIYDFIQGAGCVPVMLPPVDIFGHRFMEGGLRHFIPLQLAARAFALARKKGYSEAEFIVINNYLGEPAPEDYSLLDTGLEISMRAIKIMTMELALHDLEEGNALLKEMGASDSKVIVIEPTIDYRLNPMDFNNAAVRTQMREHGISRTTLLLHPPSDNLYSREEIEQAHRSLSKTGQNPELIAKIVKHQRAHPKESFAIREKIAPHKKIVVLQEEKTPAGALSPQNLDELIEIMESARTSKKKIKAVGAGLAFSQILETEGIQISLMNHLNGIWTPDNTVLKDPDSATSLIEFEAGATIEQLTTTLWGRGRALLNQPGYEKLSFMGVASCGGHGSGIELGPLSEAIAAIDLLTFAPNGKVIHKRIEKTKGISDPDKFRNKYPDIELIQNDQFFNACKVSVGCMGVIYSLVVQTQPKFFLEERRTMQKWNDLKTQLPAKLADTNIHSIHVWFNPYKVGGEIYCVLSEYRRDSGPAHGERPPGATFGGDNELAQLLLWVMENFPNQLPSVLNESLKLMVDPEPIVMPCYQAINFGAPNTVKVVAANCGIPAAKVGEGADKLFELFQSRFATGAYVTCPIGFRFTAASEAFFSPQFGRKTCMIELPMVFGTDYATKTVSAFHTYLIDNFEGRPHWGQRINDVVNEQTIKKMYKDSWQPFVTVFKQLNDGSFDGAFTKIAGLRSLADRIAVTMLALISDLHISDGSTATNVDPSAFRILGDSIKDSAAVHGAKELHLVLLGDIFDLVRSDYWLTQYGNDLTARPWGGERDPRTGMNTSAQVETDFLAICQKIIATDSAKALLAMIKTLAAWCADPPPTSGKQIAPIPFTVTYVVGNHDRVLNNFSSLRQAIANAMPPGINFLASSFVSKIDAPEYGVLARHGWEWDLDCYGLSYYNNVLPSRANKLKRFDGDLQNVIAFGEALTAELMAGFIFYARKNLGLNGDPAQQDQSDLELLAQLMDLNNLRPMSEVINWFPWLMNNFSPEKKSLVLDALQSALKNTLNSRLAKEWPDDGGSLLTMKILNDLYFGNFIQKGLAKALIAAGKIKDVISPPKEPLIHGAETDFSNLAKKYRFVVYGHTHVAQQTCFYGELNGYYKLYVNTGTYLSIIDTTFDASGGRTDTYSTSYAMTMTFFYKGDEDTAGRPKGNSDPTMEYWDGRRRKKYEISGK